MCTVRTMDFSTLCWKSACRSLARAWIAAVLLGWQAWALAEAPSAEIVQLAAERVDGGVYVSAQMRLELAPAVADALQKGVAVHFVAQVQLLRDRWYWYDKRIATATRQMRLTYQPLTQHWKLSLTQGAGARSGLALNQTFDTLAEALQALSRLSRWKIAENVDMDPDVRHYVEFSFKLDSSELPRPLQIGILGQGDWTLAVSKSQRVATEAGK